VRAAAVAVLLSVLSAGCRHVPGRGSSGLTVSSVSVAFPREEVGDLFFEVEVPASVIRVASLRWELFLGPHRFAEGVVAFPDVVTDPAGRRRVRIASPLVYRHLGWREGSVWLDVGVRGDLQPLGADEGARLSFRGREEVLCTAAPVFDARAD